MGGRGQVRDGLIALWDTSLLSRLRPASALLDHIVHERIAGTPVRVPAPALMEVAYGYDRRSTARVGHARSLSLLTDLVSSHVVAVVPLNGRAAIVAGRLRAALPHAPARRRGDQRSKTMRQAAWLLDIQIAATAFAAGLDVATENRADFALLARELEALYPSAPPLEVVDGPV